MMSYSIGAKHLPAEKRRVITVEAVVGLAAEQNPEEITTAAIAKRMNLTQGAIFRHFQNKDAIWASVMEWMADKLMKRIEKAAEPFEKPSEALRAIFMAHVAFIVEHPGVPRILFGELQRSGETTAKRMVQALINSYVGRLSGFIDKGKAIGEFAGETDSKGAATMFIGTIQGLVMQSLLAGDVKRILADAPGAFTIYHRGIRRCNEIADSK